MTQVVPFPVRVRLPQGWRPDELRRVTAACSVAIEKGEASGWDFGLTETGDPQVYLIGPPPNFDCILCISRVGRHYVVEDGDGRVLLELDNPTTFAEHMFTALRRRKEILFAKIFVAWQAVREFCEEKTDALTGEPMEALAHIAPQLTALA